MSVASGTGRLHAAIKDLRQTWDITSDTWRDNVRVDFEKRFVTPLDENVEGLIREMDRMADILRQIRRQTEPS
jgi:uncharacterized protein YukE